MEIRFKLNPKNEKDKVIMDVLSNEYSATDTIKNLLYKIALSGAEGIRMSYGGEENNTIVSTNERNSPVHDVKGMRIKEVDDDIASLFE